MKQYISIFLFLFIGGLAVKAQNMFEGKIVYEYIPLDSSVQMHLPVEEIVYYKGHKFKKATRQQGQKDYQEVITSSSSLQCTQLEKGLGGRNYALQYVPSNIYSTKEDSVAVFTDETKMIAGYTCKKVILKSQKLGLIEAYYTNEISDRMMNYNTPYFQVDGALLEQTVMSPDGRKYKVIAKQVLREKVSDEILSIPPGFETITWKQWKEIKHRVEQEGKEK